MKRITGSLFLALLFFHFSAAYAQLPEITNGLNYLNSIQNPDGSWGDLSSSTEVMPSTVSVIEALLELGETASQNYSDAVTWVQNQYLDTTDYLSERIQAISVSGIDQDALLSYFDEIYAGAWGGYGDYDSNTVDTALALLALSRVNYAGLDMIGYALSYLIDNQNADGGFGLYSGDDSNTYITCLVLKTFNSYNGTFDLQDEINDAGAYLLTKQNPDGGFGSSPSTVYETALAFMALTEAGTGTALSLQNAITFLQTNQQPNGSWNDDPYSTALALRALANVKPNLAVSSSDITFSNLTPKVGDTITVTATVRNTGSAGADTVLVQFYDGDPANGGILINEYIIPSISSFDNSEVSVNWTISTATMNEVYVSADPQNVIEEIEESDNIASRNLTAATLPDLSITAGDITFTPSLPDAGVSVTITGTVRNTGETGTNNVTVDFYDGDPESGGLLIGNTTIPSLGAGSSVTTQLTHTFTGASHDIHVVIDGANSIIESSEANNAAVKTLHFGTDYIDLSISNTDISFSLPFPVTGDLVTISATIYNEGTIEAADVMVRFYLGDPDAGGMQIGTDTVIPAILARSTLTVNTPWDSAGLEGNMNIYVNVDPLDTITELTIDNNSAFNTLAVAAITGPDLIMTPADINISPLDPITGDIVTITANIRNIGTKEANNVVLEFSNGDPEAGGTLIFGSERIPFIAQGDAVSIQTTWNTTRFAGTYEIHVNADPFNAVAELDELNNISHLPLTITAPQGPDITIQALDTSGLITDTQTLQTGGSLLVTLENKGNVDTTAPFTITAFEDTNGNETFDLGIDTIIWESAYTKTLAAGNTDTVAVTLDDPVLFRDNLISILADTGNTIDELDETNNGRNTGQECEYIPPVGQFNPVEKWAWTESAVDPSYSQVLSGAAVARIADTNSNGIIDHSDVPAVIFTAHRGVNCYAGCGGYLVVVRGDTGEELFTITGSSNRVRNNAMPAVGDIDLDGLPEIIALKGDSQRLMAFEHDGTKKWISEYFPPSHMGGASIADMDNDGKPELIMGAAVLNSDGTIKWQGTAGSGTNNGRGQLSLVADIDLDGNPEVVAGNTAYRHDGSIYWSAATTDGFDAVGNLDEDPYAEIVLVSKNNVYMLEHDGTITWGPVAIPNGGTGGAPTISDFDGDGEAEIGVAGSRRYIVINNDGSILWQSIIQDISSNYTGSSVFDFDGDGLSEVAYADEKYFRIFDGSTGLVLFETTNTSLTSVEYPVIADIDNDNRAEVVIPANNWYMSGGFHGIRVFEDANNTWVNTRKIWNQHTYHITNINDDGSVPRHEQNNWEIYNNYRCNSLLPGEVIRTSDITASYITIDQTNYPATVSISVRIGNGGAVSHSAGVSVSFYDGNPSHGGTLIGTNTTSQILEKGEYEDVSIVWYTPSVGDHDIHVVADENNDFNECREENNTAIVSITIDGGGPQPQELPDLEITTSDISMVTPVIEGQSALVSATIHNIGTLATSNVVVSFFDGDPKSSGVHIDSVTLSAIDAGANALAEITWDTVGQAGINYIHIVVDPDNLIEESNDNNNASLIQTDVTPPTKPDLLVKANDIAFSHPSPSEGDALTLTATIANLGIATGNVQVDLYDGDPGSGGLLIASQTIVPVIPFGGQTQIAFTIETTGYVGSHSYFVVVDPDNAIVEENEGNNSASGDVLINGAGLGLAAATDKTQYIESEDVLITVTVSDLQNQIRDLSVDIQIIDSDGALTATVPAQSLTLNPFETQTLNFTWNTGNTLVGNYDVQATVYDTNSTPLVRQKVPSSITSSAGITMNVVLDKISYKTNEAVKITSTVFSESENQIYDNFTTTVTIEDQNAQVLFTEDAAISLLAPLSSRKIDSYWNTSINPAGDYAVTGEVRDSEGTVISSITKILTINSALDPAVHLSGQISVDTQSILQGDPVEISYSMSNVGNVDLSTVDLSILIVDVVDLTVHDTLTDQTVLLMSETFTNTQLLDTQTYTAKDYLVILRATVSGNDATLASTYFRVAGAPSAPSINNPSHGEDVETVTPLLAVNNASDPNDDDLTYEFELFDDDTVTNLITSSGVIDEGISTTSWQVPSDLQENAWYYWRARAYDGMLYGDWIMPASFRVNVANDPPTTPTLSSPADNSEVDTFTPLLTVNNASDPDSSNLTYNLEMALDIDFTQIVISETGIFEGIGTTTWEVPILLAENTQYYWRAQADDWLIEGPWMMPAGFFVNTTNEAPPVPSIISPLNGSEITALSANITVSNSTDPESDPLTYAFELDSVSTFDSADLVSASGVPEGAGKTTWHVNGLKDNTWYYVRAKASDGLTESSWSGVIAFFVNTVNDPPTVPVLANPSNGSGVNLFSPDLSVINSTDLDGDALSYEFQVFENPDMITLVASSSLLPETEQMTSWTVPISLVENQIYYWRARAFDIDLYSDWMPLASFMVNTANDIPSAPALYAPADGNSIDTRTPTLSINNATDPDNDVLTYRFEIYENGTPVQTITNIPQDPSGVTSATLQDPLSDNATYTWRAYAYDGDRYGAWMDMATFSIHLPVAKISATIDFDPNTVNKKSKGKWVVVYIELPDGYDLHDMIISSILFENTVFAETWPYAIGDHDNDEIPDLMVKFRRSDVINILPKGDNIMVHVTGMVGTIEFGGIDSIRVTP